MLLFNAYPNMESVAYFVFCLLPLGLITKHTETWDISAVDALLSTVIPGFGAPPAPPV